MLSSCGSVSRLLFLLLLVHVRIIDVAYSHDTTVEHLSTRVLAKKAATWNTLNGEAPLVVGRGGSSGLFPDQTVYAYVDALNNSLAPVALFCDLQLTKDNVGICRTGIDLENSTNIATAYPNRSHEYTVNGVSISGYFSIDFTSDELFSHVGATQAIQSRSSAYDGVYPIFEPVNVTDTMSQINVQGLFWLHIQYAKFFEEHKASMTSYVLTVLNSLRVDYISSPEVAFLKGIQTAAQKKKTKLIFQFLNVKDLEPTTNVTYGSWLKNLKGIKAFASGILVPKNFIWPLNSDGTYLQPQTTLIQDAHNVGLEVYASGFANDEYPQAYNFSFDPIQEYLYFISGTGPIVDGVLTDFPVTASEAIACYSSKSQVASSNLETEIGNPYVISHNGASGDYPGCTLLAYQGAVKSGVSYIDCPVQMTKDGVPICRESPDLLVSTDVSETDFYPSRLSSIPQLQKDMGIFSFNLTLKEINSLKAKMYSPEAADYNIFRTSAYDNTQSILTLSDFLSFARNSSKVGILIDIQNAYFLETTIHLDVVDAVLSELKASGYKTSDQVLIQSEDSAVLKRFKQLQPYKVVYRIENSDVSISKSTIQQIKQFTDVVTLPRQLVAYAYDIGFLANDTRVVLDFQAQNVSVFVYYLRNEFVSLAFDYQSDPTLEINTMVNFYGVNGLITDFPATARSYLGNSCRNIKTQAGGSTYSMRLVLPGDLLPTLPAAPAPVPAASPLPVSQPALPPSVNGSPIPSPNSSAPTPAGVAPGPYTPSSQPSSPPSAAGRMSPSYVVLVLSLFYFYVTLL